MVIFKINGKSYVVSKSYVKSIVNIDKIALLEGCIEEVLGTIEINGKSYMVIDLKIALCNGVTSDYSESVGLLCEFKGKEFILLVEEILSKETKKFEEREKINWKEYESLRLDKGLIEDLSIRAFDFQEIENVIDFISIYEKNLESMEMKVTERKKEILEIVKCKLLENGYHDVKLVYNEIREELSIIDSTNNSDD